MTGWERLDAKYSYYNMWDLGYFLGIPTFSIVRPFCAIVVFF
jgi:hypothetical protein